MDIQHHADTIRKALDKHLDQTQVSEAKIAIDVIEQMCEESATHTQRKELNEGSIKQFLINNGEHLIGSKQDWSILALIMSHHYANTDEAMERWIVLYSLAYPSLRVSTLFENWYASINNEYLMRTPAYSMVVDRITL